MEWFTELSGVWQALLASGFTCLMTALGASLIFFSAKINEKVLTAMVSGAAGIMIAASFFSLLLPAIECESPLPVWAVVTVGFLLGGGFIVCGDVILSRAVFRTDTAGHRSALLYTAVTLHNIPEGMAVGVAFGAGMGDAAGAVAAWMLAVGIGIQNFPEGACVAYPLKARGFSAAKSFFLSVVSGMVEMVAAVFGALAAEKAVGLMPWALSFSAGAMIAVVCSELIPDCFEKHKLVATAGVVLGFSLMMILDLALG